jgi:hypothetical protein
MALSLRVKDLGGHEHPLVINGNPDTCPVCHKGIEPRDKKCDLIITSAGPSVVERVLACPRKQCSRLFIARYTRIGQDSNFSLAACVPFEPIEVELDAELQAVSPDFCAIY